ncbi:Lrp/AsnC family transcriptional regulator [Candidatus Bathyarchaeota archaeon]|nr:Lrp/AsnC family transcriptional regulator [Candidatus Bathyarchaeota archaeon]MBS7636044.1 Lrp/AsnC family transcriptional regulator [Candidatus Bathyarchaeota archaeon]
MEDTNVQKSPSKEKKRKRRSRNEEELNDVDMKILKALTLDARLSSRQLAKQCNISTSTALSRVKKLEETGIIKGYTTLIDHEKLGYALTVVVEITVSKGRLLEVESEIAKLPNVCCVYDVTGLIDAVVIAKFKNREELSKFAKRLLAMPYVERTNTHVVLTTIKEDFRII